jgi:hypothetical protein
VEAFRAGAIVNAPHALSIHFNLMVKAFLVSDMFGDLLPRETKYLGDWEARLRTRGYATQTIFLNQLAGISPLQPCSVQSLEGDLHSKYIGEGRLETAASKLRCYLKDEAGPKVILGFSMGDMAVWLAAETLDMGCTLLLLSSTRLRKVASPIRAPHRCLSIFGKSDPYAPTQSHLESLHIDAHYIEGEHEFYKDMGSYEAIACAWLGDRLPTMFGR